MLLDFTKEIELTASEKKHYNALRAGLFAFFFAGAFFVSFRIMFPTQYFTFDFANPNSTKNTIVRPRLAESPISKGSVPQTQSLFFDTALVGNFSIAEVSFELNKNFPRPAAGEITVRKSYQAFLYPEKLADASLLTDQKSVDRDLPYPSGTLVSNTESVFVTSGNRLLPIDSTFTFAAMGYRWEDVLPIASDDAFKYEKQKLLTLFSAHPDGTIFQDRDTSRHFLIQAGQKFPLTEEDLAQIKTNSLPIPASSESAQIFEGCQLKKSFWSSRKYSCEIPVEKMQNFLGKDYEFGTTFSSDVKIDTLDVKFKQNIVWNNFRATVGLILSRIRDNYAAN